MFTGLIFILVYFLIIISKFTNCDFSNIQNGRTEALDNFFGNNLRLAAAADHRINLRIARRRLRLLMFNPAKFSGKLQFLLRRGDCPQIAVRITRRT